MSGVPANLARRSPHERLLWRWALPGPGCACQRRGMRTKVYGERRLLGFSAQDMFSVVSAVERYHSFVPWCRKSLVLERSDKELVAELGIGFPPFVGESYKSRVTLFRPYVVTAISEDTALFEHLKSAWEFRPQDRRTCHVDFAVSFKFKSGRHALFAKYFFDEVIERNVDAFLGEAERRFGPATIARQEPIVYAKR